MLFPALRAPGTRRHENLDDRKSMNGRTPSIRRSEKRRFAFVVNSDSPIASWSVLRNLQTQFPDHEVDLIHVSDALKSSLPTLALSALEVLAQYPFDIAMGRKKLRNAVFRSKTVARFVQGLVHQTVSAETHDFVFQMQSLWSARVQGIPHFLFTDHTNLTHETYPLPDLGAIYNNGFLEREKAIYQNAAAVFTRSENVTRDVVDRYGAEQARVKCVYVGANTETDEEGAKPVAKRDPNDKIVLFVGVDWERKGGPDLVEAFEILFQRHKDARLVVAGCQPEDLPEHLPVEVLGRLPNEALAEHYARASVFCMPTLREPFGIVFTEAMSFGLPLVGTDIGAVPDFIVSDWNGYLVPPRDPPHLAEALSKLLDDPDLRATFGARSKSLAQDRYNWPAVVGRMAERIEREIAAAPA